jgi:hypothetical protein
MPGLGFLAPGTYIKKKSIRKSKNFAYPECPRSREYCHANMVPQSRQVGEKHAGVCESPYIKSGYGRPHVSPLLFEVGRGYSGRRFSRTCTFRACKNMLGSSLLLKGKTRCRVDMRGRTSGCISLTFRVRQAVFGGWI